MTAPPFMQMYWSDYFGDTRHLSCEQHGAYLQLLGSMWLAGGKLPNDDRKLAKITGCTASRWAKIRADVMEFFEVEGEFISHKRIVFELKKAQEKSIKRAEVGSRGGRAKALKNKETPVAIASDLLNHSPDIRTREYISEPKGSSPKTELADRIWGLQPPKHRRSTRPDVRKAVDAALRRGADPADLEAACRAYYRLPASREDEGKFAKGAHRIIEADRWRD